MAGDGGIIIVVDSVGGTGGGSGLPLFDGSVVGIGGETGDGVPIGNMLGACEAPQPQLLPLEGIE